MKRDGECVVLPLIPCLPTAYIYTDHKGCFNLFGFLLFLLKWKTSVIFLKDVYLVLS